MEPARGTRPHDPDLDRPAGLPPVRLEAYFEEYQRLIANPFLALTAFMLWLEAAHRAFQTRSLVLVLSLVVALIGVACLLQFHCLDCGTTDSLFRWRRHACAPAIARQMAGRPRRFRGPNPTTQTVLWAYAVIIVAVLAVLVVRGRR